MSNDRYIANTNKKLKQLCEIHKQILLDYSLKHTSMIGIFTKEWEDQFHNNLCKIQNQHSIEVENVIFNLIKTIENMLNFTKKIFDIHC